MFWIQENKFLVVVTCKVLTLKKQISTESERTTFISKSVIYGFKLTNTLSEIVTKRNLAIHSVHHRGSLLVPLNLFVCLKWIKWVTLANEWHFFTYECSADFEGILLLSIRTVWPQYLYFVGMQRQATLKNNALYNWSL